MLLTLLNIVVPVFVIALAGFWFGRRWRGDTGMAFINHANLMLFVPALVFSALVENPISVTHDWPLMLAGVFVVVLPGALLMWVTPQGVTRAAFLVPGMFRNTGNLGIPLMMLAYGREYLGDIVLLMVLSNLLHFSLGIYLLSHGEKRWDWVANPNVWAAALGVWLASQREEIPASVLTSLDLLGQMAIPLMLFALGVRLSQEKLGQVGLALRINGIYLLAGLAVLPVVLWLVPLTPTWTRMLVLSALLPPAVMNFLLCEQYRAEPTTVAKVVLVGNLLSIVTVPLVVWATLVWL